MRGRERALVSMNEASNSPSGAKEGEPDRQGECPSSLRGDEPRKIQRTLSLVTVKFKVRVCTVLFGLVIPTGWLQTVIAVVNYHLVTSFLRDFYFIPAVDVCGSG